MFRLPIGERVDPMEEKRQARENTISSVITFCVLCAAIRLVGFGFNLAKALKIALQGSEKKLSSNPCGY